MKLSIKGDELKVTLKIKINDEETVVFGNNIVEFDLDENKEYDIIVIPDIRYDGGFGSVVFGYPETKGYLYWEEMIDAIKMESKIHYTKEMGTILVLRYRESFYRKETKSWYLPKLYCNLQLVNDNEYKADIKGLKLGAKQDAAFWIMLVNTIGLLFLALIFDGTPIDLVTLLSIIVGIVVVMVMVDIFIYTSKMSNVKTLYNKIKDRYDVK